MSTFPVIAVLIGLILIVLLGVMIFIKRRGGEMPPTDYRVLFIIGISWLPIGIATDNPAFWGVGAIFIIIALANRDKWQIDSKSSHQASQNNALTLFLIGLGVFLLVSLVAYLLIRGA